MNSKSYFQIMEGVVEEEVGLVMNYAHLNI